MQTESIIAFQQFSIVDSYMQIKSAVVTHCYLAMAVCIVLTHRNVMLYVHFLSCLFTHMENKVV
jgi:hypothetical protein